MTKKLIWRLGKLPTPNEVSLLVQDKIITQEEAKEILFKQESDDERDTDSLKEEIKFLRTLVEKLSNNDRTTIYKYVETYPRNVWTTPYYSWCTTSNLIGNGTLTAVGGSNSINYLSTSGSSNDLLVSYSGGATGAQVSDSFSDIKTF